MVKSVKGYRPRPRVALVGSFDEPTRNSLVRFFPTVWKGLTFQSIEQLVNPVEIDLVIIGSHVPLVPDWIKNVHIICFSNSSKIKLPGPDDGDLIFIADKSKTEQFTLPKLPFAKDRLREFDLAEVENAKGWSLLAIGSYKHHVPDKSVKVFLEGSLALDPHSNRPYATIFKRILSKHGVAWLPNKSFRMFPWVELISMEFGKLDPDSFPDFGDWTKNSEWQTSDEVRITDQISLLEKEKQEQINEFNKKINCLQANLLDESIKANKGIRRLITSQSNDLLDEVAQSFKSLGFEVNKIDEELPKESLRREDLRIQDSDEKWEAIIEVRGYARSGGKTSDLSRLARFANFYESEKGRLQNKRIYVVNGQTDLPPSQRQSPLISSPEDVSEFEKQDGIIIWSLDLFRVLKEITKDKLPEVRRSLREASGQWPKRKGNAFIFNNNP